MLETGDATNSGCPSIINRMRFSSSGHLYLMYDARKHGMSHLEAPFSIIVINRPFLLMKCSDRSARMRSDSNRNTLLLSSARKDENKATN